MHHHHMLAVYVSIATSLFVAFELAAYAYYAGTTNNKDRDG